MARGRQPGDEQVLEELLMEAASLSEESARLELRKIRVMRDIVTRMSRRELVTA